MTAKLWSAALVLLSLALAGCAGDFNVKQTEPIRVQLDGSESETVRVSEDDDEPQEFVVEDTADEDSVEVIVEVRQVSEGPVRVMVTVQDEESNETLASKEIVVGGANATSTTGTQPAEEEDTASENIVVNVKGKDNIVVITQAQEGEADVNVAARGTVQTT